MARKIMMAPGSIFSVDPQQQSPWCRYNVGFVSDPRFISAATTVVGTRSKSSA
jgi:hypothetical protein